MKKIFKKNWLIILVLILAAFLRLYKISGYMEFLGDQGRDVLIVYRFLKKGDLMFIGPQTSIGNMYLGPWYYYLMAPALLLANFNPVGPAVMVALLGVATVWLIWFVTREWFNQKAALTASFLYAISPVVIKYSNFSWNPNIMPFFALLSIWFVWEIWQKNKYKDFPLLAISLAIILNSHYLGLLFLPLVSFFWLLGFKKNKNRKPFILYTLYSVPIFFFLMSPLLLFDLRHDWMNFEAIQTFFTVRQTTVNLKIYKSIPRLWPLFSQIITRLLAGKNELWGQRIAIGMILGIFWLVWRKRGEKRKKELKALFLICFWFLIGIIGLGVYKQHIYDHYFGFLFPAPFILAGFLVGELFKKKLVGNFLGTIFLLFLVFLSFKENPFRYSPNNQLATSDEITDFIIQESGGQPFNLALLAKQNYDAPYHYLFTLKKAPLCNLHDNLTDQLFVICEPWQIECKPLGHPLWAIAAFGWAEIEGEWEINGIRIFKLIHFN
mgnify:CR=1 FL=1